MRRWHCRVHDGEVDWVDIIQRGWWERGWGWEGGRGPGRGDGNGVRGAGWETIRRGWRSTTAVVVVVFFVRGPPLLPGTVWNIGTRGRTPGVGTPEQCRGISPTPPSSSPTPVLPQ